MDIKSIQMVKRNMHFDIIFSSSTCIISRYLFHNWESIPKKCRTFRQLCTFDKCICHRKSITQTEYMATVSIQEYI